MTMKMKTLKRVLLLAMTPVIAMGMLPTVTFASNAEDPVTEISVYKTVEVENKGTLLPSEKFIISMVPATADDLNPVVDGVATPVKDSNNQTIEAGPELVNNSVTFTFDATDNTLDGTVTKEEKFKLSFKTSFDHTGVYRYYISETGSIGMDGNIVSSDQDNGYIEFDKTKYAVDLYVEQNTSGQYVVSNVVTTIPNQTTKPQSISFTNKIDCSTLKIYKEVKGTEYKQGELYTFRILIPVGGTTIVLEDGQTFQARICDKNGTVIDTENNRTDENGNVTIKVAGDSITADMETYGNTFQLKNGEWLELLGVPVTMIYKVEEVTDTEQFKKEGYTVTYDYKEYGENETGSSGLKKDQEGSVVQGTINTESNEVTFRNTRNIEIPNSGISVDIIPYVLLMVVAVCGVILFVFKKRRSAH
jgi:hypothetical protein